METILAVATKTRRTQVDICECNPASHSPDGIYKHGGWTHYGLRVIVKYCLGRTATSASKAPCVFLFTEHPYYVHVLAKKTPPFKLFLLFYILKQYANYFLYIHCFKMLCTNLFCAFWKTLVTKMLINTNKKKSAHFKAFDKHIKLCRGIVSCPCIYYSIA